MVELLEREQLLAELGALRADGGRLVFVGGEAGVGKTALVRAFEDDVGEVLRGVVREPGGADAARAVPRRRRRAAASRARSRPRCSSAAACSCSRTCTGRTGLARRPARARAARRRVGRVRRRHLPRRRGRPATIRYASSSASSRRRRASCGCRSRGSRWRPCASWRTPHGADAEAIHRLTLGNAFFVTEILAAGGGELPETVRDAVLARVALLDEPARRLIEAIAVIPLRAELWLLEQIVPAELERLEACLESGVIRGDRDGVAFRHELARLAVESSLAPHRRRALHETDPRARSPTAAISRGSRITRRRRATSRRCSSTRRRQREAASRLELASRGGGAVRARAAARGRRSRRPSGPRCSPRTPTKRS